MGEEKKRRKITLKIETLANGSDDNVTREFNTSRVKHEIGATWSDTRNAFFARKVGTAKTHNFATIYICSSSTKRIT